MSASLVEPTAAWPRGWEGFIAGSPDDWRLLRRLRVIEGPTGEGVADAPNVGVAVDVETTGLDLERDPVIELAVRRFRFDDAGRVTKIDRAYSWLEDPGRPLPAEIVALTGLTDDDLSGREIDEGAAERILAGADLIVAHNARFDRPRVERRLPRAAGLRWACSLEEVDWRGRGFEGRVLGHLLTQVGLFHQAHRAGDDVDALLSLLRHRHADGTTVMAELVERSWRGGWLVRAVGAGFGVKDDLKARGYRWDGKAWWREVAEEAREAESWWLAGNVYSVEANAKALGPDWQAVTNRERWA